MTLANDIATLKLPYGVLRIWHKSSGSYDYYIRDQVARAQECKAPQDALFERYNSQGRTGEWATLSELDPEHPFRLKIERLREGA